jgi:hypothetical protein
MTGRERNSWNETGWNRKAEQARIRQEGSGRVGIRLDGIGEERREQWNR